MPSTHLTHVQQDLEATALHLEALHRMLEGHAVFLKHKPCGDQTEELLLVERRLGGLAVSIQDLRGAALNISRAA
ncbi:hypothetical protein SFA35_25395 (plasmid) [Pseudomonas sp. HR96]|uniref:hypothetical protein n=1 Tax=Pseudomonas sp. HR96 TaxID=1027966 RepID=UPI002A74A4FE|nr:hypothetical protein [Pseudomonas sp. HR96]WPP02500.1 hypothetical protein SFA35_25395 [Pseudomonas sp. HR96]